MADRVDRRAEALRRLPELHSLAIRLREAGMPDPLIAECLNIDPVSVASLLEVAQAKLATILSDAEGDQ